jgi:hypothetical protein
MLWLFTTNVTLLIHNLHNSICTCLAVHVYVRHLGIQYHLPNSSYNDIYVYMYVDSKYTSQSAINLYMYCNTHRVYTRLMSIHGGLSVPRPQFNAQSTSIDTDQAICQTNFTGPVYSCEHHYTTRLQLRNLLRNNDITHGNKQFQGYMYMVPCPGK